MKYLIKILIILLFVPCFCQDSISPKDLNKYEEAYKFLANILEGNEPYSFKKAVFKVESAYLDKKYSFDDFTYEISKVKDVVSLYRKINGRNLDYVYSDKENFLTWASIYTVMTDSMIIFDSNTIYTSYPYTYDFEDALGNKDWQSMFVIKLLNTGKGNCHSLPYLYKILAEDLGVSAHLAIAPNHMYIKHNSEGLGVYNTELTSASFPIDAWLMASGYIHLDAIRSGIYMDRLDNKQSISLCLIDLAKGFEKKYGYINDGFIEKCLIKALEYYPTSINAMLFYSEVLKRKMDGIENVELKNTIFNNYQNLILKIYKLGYRKMPEEMYVNWLLDLKENKDKYSNKKIANNLKNDIDNAE